VMPVVVIPRALQEKLGDEGSRALAEVLEKTVDSGQRELLDGMEARMRAVVAESEARLERRIGEVQTGLERRIGEVQTGLERRIGGVEVRVLRWAFAFWVAQLAAFVGFFLVHR
jgi:hypothetical protein